MYYKIDSNYFKPLGYASLLFSVNIAQEVQMSKVLVFQYTFVYRHQIEILYHFHTS